MKKPKPTQKPKSPAVDTAVQVAIEASKATPVLTDTQKLELFQAAQRFDIANNNASPQGIAAALEQLMHERIEKLKAAEAHMKAVGAPLGRAGYALDVRTGVYTKTP